MKRIFITGICGFLGSNLALYFQSLGYKVYGIDNLSRRGSEKNFKILKNRNIKIFKADLKKSNSINLFKKEKSFAAFIHCAALTSVLDGTNNISTEFLYENNILSTLNSLRLCKFLKSKFIYISSSRVYSINKLNELKFRIAKNKFQLINKKNHTTSSKGVNENFSVNSPLSLYGSSKLMCENLVAEYCNFNNILFVINRCGLLAGSGQLFKNDQGIISYWINSWKKRKKLNYIGFGGNGYQVRDCLHPEDLSNLINQQIKFLYKKKLKEKIFNVSGGAKSAFSLKELSQWCSKNIFFKKVGYQNKIRPFDLKWIILDNTKVKKFFQWQIKISKTEIFEDILFNDD